MYIFLGAGVLYIAGVATILLLRPSLMFSPDGSWKEFGIGKDTEHFSPFPFWMFCIVWALVSYGVVLALARAGGSVEDAPRMNRRNNVQANHQSAPQTPFTQDQDDGAPFELPEGYYMLNRKTKNGIPKYVFIGKDVDIE
jgi:hypothetical protein